METPPNEFETDEERYLPVKPPPQPPRPSRMASDISLKERLSGMRFETYPFDVFYSSLGNALMTQMRGRRKDRRLVQHDIARWVEKFISSPNPRVIRWRSVIANLSRNVGDFHKLPLCFAHPFLTGETIIVNSNFTKDDEGRYRVDVVREFDMAERHFWASVFGSLDKASKAEATGNISLIQDAFRLSTLLNYFPLDADDEPQPPSRLLVENLPFFLSYRIPQVRGPQDVAFDDELEERIENWLCKPTANGTMKEWNTPRRQANQLRRTAKAAITGPTKPLKVIKAVKQKRTPEYHE
ncbi:uncharacterized protein VDAG_02930 [Verticillium dahliae VdLs.17]|uniref:Uncharacterized protein n=2 Tax=Verticillium dahliae TaxID=27337 RepID=G2WXF1_VERDV|nr:uncharacterized protein VDAG_02930 [Verticillium dahliae VdLs.17]EGY21406.1 hypothetical protein VDAG_02930 [Verticillium dahliae VdLs.17]KAH6707405.1 hypothetical protein EV126DRAFT_457651 [Verticillium dahliae]